MILNQFEMRNEKKLFQNYLCVELYWFCLSCGNLKTRDWAWTKHLLHPLIYTEGRKDKTIKIVFFKSISSFRNLVGLIVKLKRLWTDGKWEELWLTAALRWHWHCTFISWWLIAQYEFVLLIPTARGRFKQLINCPSSCQLPLSKLRGSNFVITF